MNQYDITVIGGGIVGLASAYKLQLRNPELRILVLEKEEKLAQHQTGRNSGVIHSGLYYKPGSYKAKNCVDGRRELVAFSALHKIPHDICGKIVVATHESELPHMERIYNNGIANNVEGVSKITGEQIREIEPYCTGIAGLQVACTGIIDYVAVVEKLAELIPGLNPESKVLTGREVRSIVQGEESTEIFTQKEKFLSRHLVFCAGLHSDRMAVKDGAEREARIVGFRGDYYDLAPEAAYKVKHLIYPVPNPAFPFLGVHFTRMVHGGIECGPNAVFSFKREGYNKTDFSLADSADALSYSGTWKLFTKHWKYGLGEYHRAFSKREFLRQIQRLVPSLTMEEIVPARAGVRAMALGPDGNMIDDFKIQYHRNSIHVLNAPSPAATACLAIGEEVAHMAEDRFGIKVASN